MIRKCLLTTSSLLIMGKTVKYIFGLLKVVFIAALMQSAIAQEATKNTNQNETKVDISSEKLEQLISETVARRADHCAHPADDILNEEKRSEKQIQVDCLPSCTRLCVNLVLLPVGCPVLKDPVQKGANCEIEGIVFGSCQFSVFDEQFLLRKGDRKLRLWPFESFNPRMVC